MANAIQFSVDNTGIGAATTDSQVLNLIPPSDIPDLTNTRSAAPITTNPEIQSAMTKASVAGSLNLVYPPDLASSLYYINFQFMKYVRPSVFSTALAPTEFTITLPIPRDLQETFHIKYDDRDLGPIMGNLAEDAGALVHAGGQAGGVSNLTNQVTSNWKNLLASRAYGVGDDIIRRAGGAIGGDLADIAESVAGAIPNPHPSVFFRGMQLRRHRFSWVFVPQSRQDTDTLSNVLLKIKSRVLPVFENGPESNILDYPYMVLPNVSPAIGLTYKKCMVENLNINYTTKGIPAFFKGSLQPVAIGVTMDLLEIEQYTAQDADPTFVSGGNAIASLNDLIGVFEQTFKSIGSSLGQ